MKVSILGGFAEGAFSEEFKRAMNDPYQRRQYELFIQEQMQQLSLDLKAAQLKFFKPASPEVPQEQASQSKQTHDPEVPANPALTKN